VSPLLTLYLPFVAATPPGCFNGCAQLVPDITVVPRRRDCNSSRTGLNAWLPFPDHALLWVMAVGYGMKKGSSLIACRHSSTDRSEYSSIHCPVWRMNARLKLLAPVYSRRANFASNDGESAFGPGLR